MIEFRLSGGAANTEPTLSTGGAMSSVSVPSGEAVTWAGVGIAGIAVESGHGNQPDTSGGASSAALVLTTNAASGARELTFTPYGVAPGTLAADFANRANVTAGGPFALAYGNKSVVVVITPASLPTGEATAKLNATRAALGLFDDTTSDEAKLGATEDRCIYVRNAGASAKTVTLGLSRRPASADLTLGLDPAGVGGTAGPNAGATAFAASTVATLPAGASVPLWLRRAVKAALPTAHAADFALITARATA